MNHGRMSQATRREFIQRSGGMALLMGTGPFAAHASAGNQADAADALFKAFQDPPHTYTLIPFWFLNDDLKEEELKRQLDDFAAHGVYGVVPHARIGLPEDIGWMSDRWMHFLKVIVEHAAKRDMSIILYDEGMYPSGSCHGQVVAANPKHATRCIERVRLGRKKMTVDEEVIHKDDRYAYVHTTSGGHIRGVHFGTDDGEPGAPPSADILNPEAVASFLHLTHDKHYEVLAEHFGKTISAIFTDEPDTLGRGRKRGVCPWTWDFEVFLQDYLGYDFREHLPALWDKSRPNAEKHKRDFEHAVNARLEQTYYKPYSDWCKAHKVELTGHPAGPMDIGTLKYFQLPGQDVVWRYLEPFQTKSLEGPQSTMGKCSASAQVHYGRKRNMNECFGAYGWEFTYEEMRWLTDWLLVRGVNLIMPHAFYYSVRGPRRDERPPDVGPNNVWWGDYKTYADYCRRISWLLGEGTQVCKIAVLASAIHLPWRAARVLFENQRDFNYLDTDTLLSKASITADAISVGGMQYAALIIDGQETVNPDAMKALKPFIDAEHVISYTDPIAGVPTTAAEPKSLLEKLAAITTPDVRLSPANPNVRYHHVCHGKTQFYFFTNEGPGHVDVHVQTAAKGKATWWDPESATIEHDKTPDRLALLPYTSRVLCVKPV